MRCSYLHLHSRFRITWTLLTRNGVYLRKQGNYTKTSVSNSDWMYVYPGLQSSQVKGHENLSVGELENGNAVHSWNY